MMAIKNGQMSVVQSLVEKEKMDINIMDEVKNSISSELVNSRK